MKKKRYVLMKIFGGWLVVDTLTDKTVSLLYDTKKMASDWLENEIKRGRLIQLETLQPVDVPGVIKLAPDQIIISEKTFKNLKTELKRLKGDIKCCEIEEIRPLVPHLGMGKLDASKHLLEHIETIERLLGIEDEN